MIGIRDPDRVKLPYCHCEKLLRICYGIEGSSVIQSLLVEYRNSNLQYSVEYLGGTRAESRRRKYVETCL